MAYVVAAAVIAVLLVIALMAWKLSAKRVLRGSALDRVRRGWRHAEAQPQQTLQILEADKVLDLALGLLGYGGTLGEKLKKAGPRFSDLNGLWAAHKLRNSLAHDVGVRLSPEQAGRAMRAFRAGLRDLGWK